ncbi:MAG: FAD-dependent oxidoreductase [Actinobacteria bacterium]|nr:FAD-dependent oxidoreductase [Actinomycetota bacterium]
MKVLIVGAGLAGLRSAESLRGVGFAGEITIVGEEPHFPYNRPPLSKDALANGLTIADLEFKRRESIADVTWIFNDSAISTDYQKQNVLLDSGRLESFDVLVAATGIRPRRLKVPGAEKSKFSLRNFMEAQELRASMLGARKMVIVGAGFIGCEIAATARKLGIDVAVVAADPEPMFRPLGAEFGRAMRRRHEAHDVSFHMDAKIAGYLGGDSATGVSLESGEEILGDLVVEAIGSLPNTEWLAGGELDLQDGVLVDSSMRATAPSDLSVYAVGDVARYAFDLFDSTPRRIEHWNLPTETGRRAGKSIAHFLTTGEVLAEPVNFVPSFWSDQYDDNLQSFGILGIADSIKVVEGDLMGDCVVEYLRGDNVVGVVGVNTSAKLAPYRKRFQEIN